MDIAEKIMRTLGPGEAFEGDAEAVTVEFAGRTHVVQACIGMLGKDLILLVGQGKTEVTNDFVIERLLKCACAAAIKRDGTSQDALLSLAGELADAFSHAAAFMERHQSASKVKQ